MKNPCICSFFLEIYMTLKRTRPGTIAALAKNILQNLLYSSFCLLVCSTQPAHLLAADAVAGVRAPVEDLVALPLLAPPRPLLVQIEAELL